MFARLYKAHHHLHMEDLPFWQAICDQNNGSVLELGCGTGRILLPLADRGKSVFGIDRDRDMLTVLQKQLKLPSKRIHLIQTDIRYFAFGIRFPTILLPCNTFSTLSYQSRGETLRNVSRHLSSDGLFAVSMPNPSLLESLPSSSPLEYEETIRHPIDGQPVIVSSGWKRTSKQMKFEWLYEHRPLNGDPIRYQKHTTHFITPMHAHLEAFESSGLKVYDIFGDFNYSELEEDSPFLIMVAGKN